VTWVAWTAVVLSAVSGRAEGTSGGDDVYICNVWSDKLGCAEDRFENGNRADCLDKVSGKNPNGQEMWWVTKAKRSASYSLFAGRSQNPALASNIYHPNKLNRIHVSVNKVGAEYRGIMLQAFDSNEDLVGDWEIPDEQTSSFQHANICKRTLLHADADLKGMVETFLFRGPPPGTGEIVIDALIKFGNANVGEFYWPNADGPLVLQEAPPDNDGLEWVRSDLGQSCTEACTNRGSSCSESTLEQVSSAATLEAVAAGEFACQLPLLSHCEEGVGPTSSSKSLCYFHNPELCTGGRNVPKTKVNCDASSTNELVGLRFCPCISTQELMDSAAASAYSKTWGTILSSLTFGALFHSDRGGFHVAVTLFTIMQLCQTALGHNWVESQSRAFKGSTVKPCPARQVDVPHVQVTAGQEFEMEWVTAHGSAAYFAIVRAEDEHKLKKRDLEKYLEACPQSAMFMEEGNKNRYRKFHRKSSPGTDLNGKDNFFESQIEPGDGDFSERTEAFAVHSVSRESRRNDLPFAVRYKERDVQNDVRCAYTNLDMPHILEVSRFKLIAMEPRKTVDAARFRIGRFDKFHQATPPGNYVVWYSWRGYSDCTDVQVVKESKPVEKPYGTLIAANTYSRIDHCAFNVKNIHDNRCIEVVEDLQQCIAICNNRGPCRGVQVAPIMLPDSVAHVFRNTSFAPLSRNNAPLVDENGNELPWCRGSAFSGNNGMSTELQKSSLLCYAVEPQKPSETENIFRTTEDAQSPVFYGTCFKRNVDQVVFDHAAESGDQADDKPVKRLEWLVSNRCIPCKEKAKYELIQTAVPRWQVLVSNKENACVNCDLEPTTLTKAQVTTLARTEKVSHFGEDRKPRGLNRLPWTKQRALAGQLCADGLHTCARNGIDRPADYCMLPAVPRGFSVSARNYVKQVEADACLSLTQRMAGCNLDFVFYNPETKACMCFRRAKCCGTCELVLAAGFQAFSVPKLDTSGQLALNVEEDPFVDVPRLNSSRSSTASHLETSLLGVGTGAALLFVVVIANKARRHMRRENPKDKFQLAAKSPSALSSET